MDTILIVDDEPDLREGLKAILEHESFRVIACSDGHEARLRVFEDPPDLIVSDIRMPGMDGWELVNELHQLPLTKNTPFLFLTGHADHSTFAEALRSGVDGVMTKPIRPAELIATIRARLARTRSIGQESAEANALFRATLSRALPHGLNTSIHIIAGYTTLLASHIPSADAEVQEYASRIQDATRRLQVSLEKLWLVLSLEEEYAALLGSRTDTRRGPIALRPVVQSVAAELAQVTRRTVTVDDSVPAVDVRMNEPQLRDLIREVLENAILFSTQDKTVRVTGGAGPSSANVSIIDEGRGLTSESIEGLVAFERFQRDRFEKRGHGLGLTIIHRLLRLNAGDIRLESRAGEGTTITLTLPTVAIS